VSSESVGVPEAQPWMVRLPVMSWIGGDFDGIEGGADDHELAVGAEAVDELGHGFGAGGGGQDYSCSAEFLQFFGGLGGLAVDVDVGSEFLCEGCVFGAASDGCNLVAELGGELE
jgi:hypothetical protein